jgi:branched-chain amino acid transport system permease protein
MQTGDFRVTYASDERIFETRLPIVGLVALLAALAFVPLVAGTYWLDVLNRIGIAIIGAIGLNILVGFTGQISIGHAAFLAVGAYSTAILETKAGLPFWLAIPLAAAVTSVFGLVFGVPALRLKGLYLAIATLAAHFITTYGIIHWERMTNGVLGFNVAPATVFGLPLDSDARIFYLIFALVVPAVFFAKNLFRTKVGKAFVAIRDQDISAEVMGVEVFRYKLLSFGVSSFYVGVAGSLLAYQARIISPENFPLTLAIEYLGMIIIGGLGSVLGSILGATFITLLPEALRLGTGALSHEYPALIQLFAPLKLGVFGLAIVLFLVFEPDGMAARWQRIKAYWKLYPFSY